MSSWSRMTRVLVLAIGFIAVGFVMDALHVHSNMARILYLCLFMIGIGVAARSNRDGDRR